MALVYVLLMMAMTDGIVNSQVLKYPCNHTTFCKGPLLHAVMVNHLFVDSKTFVDLKIKKVPLEAYGMDLNQPDKAILKINLMVYLRRNFDPAMSGVLFSEVKDWSTNPRCLRRIRDPKLKRFAAALNEMWKLLCRSHSDDVASNKLESSQYSLIPVKRPFIVPGGRFREYYYWDSYWIVRGLLRSDMVNTTKDHIQNLVDIVDNYGFVPNGGRIYYLERSQPPLLIAMVRIYWQATNDMSFVRGVVETLEKEFRWWIRNRTRLLKVKGTSYLSCMYSNKETVLGPRPESYREDYSLVTKALNNDVSRQKVYSEIKSTAESGREFSSRWFENPENGSILTTKTSSIVPVELNSIMEWNARSLSEFYVALGRLDKAKQYAHVAANFRKTLEGLLWSDQHGCWFDYDTTAMQLRVRFYPTNVAPMWTGSVAKPQRAEMGKLILEYLKNAGAVSYPGGVSASLQKTGEQWDFPNVWAPDQDIVISALDHSGYAPAAELARDLANRWVQGCVKSFLERGTLMEKYDALHLGKPGGGGEYVNQEGYFAWTIGLTLDLLSRYGDTLSMKSSLCDNNPYESGSTANYVNLILILLPTTVLLHNILMHSP